MLAFGALAAAAALLFCIPIAGAQPVADCPDCGKVALPTDPTPPPDDAPGDAGSTAHVVSVTPAPPAGVIQQQYGTATTKQAPEIIDVLPQREPLALFTASALRRAGLDGLLDDNPQPGGTQRSNWTLFAPTVRVNKLPWFFASWLFCLIFLMFFSQQE